MKSLTHYTIGKDGTSMRPGNPRCYRRAGKVPVRAALPIAAVLLAVCTAGRGVSGDAETRREPGVFATVHTYEVSGRTAAEIRRNLNRESPVRVDGRVFDAHTRWRVRWWFDWQPCGKRCVIADVRTRVDVEQTLPRWRGGGVDDGDLTRRWRRYVEALAAHENRHKSFGVRAAGEIVAAIRAMGPRETCEALEADANTIGRRIVAKYAAIEKRFDRRTEHGAARGVRFP